MPRVNFPTSFASERKIPDKAAFYVPYVDGLLGNTIRQWDHAEFFALPSSEQPSTIAVRVKIPDNPWMKYEMTIPAAAAYCDELVGRHGLAYSDLNLSEHAPDNLTTLQGEVMRTAEGLYLRVLENVPGLRMRFALEHPEVQHLTSLRALMMLQKHADAPSMDWIRGLLDEYPSAIIEFACYSISCGVKGLNTLIWEVRNY
jgi:hypothetical protein